MVHIIKSIWEALVSGTVHRFAPDWQNIKHLESNINGGVQASPLEILMLLSLGPPVILMGSIFGEAVLYLFDCQTAMYIQIPWRSSKNADSESVIWAKAEIQHI